MTAPKAPLVLVLSAVLVAAVGLAGCGAEDAASPISLESGPRPSAAPEEPADEEPAEEPAGEDVAEFCDRLAEADPSVTIDEDPVAAAEAVRGLAEVAPAEVADALDVLAGAIEELADVEAGSPEEVSAVFEIFLRPEVIEASILLDDVASEECGLDLDMNPTEGELPDAETPTGGGGDIDLEDIDVVEEDAEAAGATWPDKISSTSIVNDVEVTLIASDDALLTQAEGMAACEQVRAALVVLNPMVVVTVTSGATTVAAAPAGQGCAPG